VSARKTVFNPFAFAIRCRVAEIDPFLNYPGTPDLWGSLIRWGLAILAVGIVIRLLFWRRSDFCIETKNGKVNYRGRVPVAIRAECNEFLLRDLGIEGPARIYGCRMPSGWRVWFRGRIGEGEKQRVRNFIVTRLRAS
jgi:hypothetical protein